MSDSNYTSNDWRIGLKVKAKKGSDESAFGTGIVKSVFPSGHHGIECENGVLEIRLDSGKVLTDSADNWITG